MPLVRFLPLRRRGAAISHWEEIGKPLERQDIEGFYDFAIHLGQGSGTQPSVSCGLSGFMLTMPEDAVNDICCPIRRQLALDVDGTAYLCSVIMTPEFGLGNAHSDSLEQLFYGTALSVIYRALSERRHKIEKCAACNWRNLCQSGCMGLSPDQKGTIWDTDDFCNYRKKLYSEAFDRMLAFEDAKTT